MKTWKSLVMVCMLLTAAFAFTSCEKDEPKSADLSLPLAVAGSYTGTFELHEQAVVSQTFSGSITLTAQSETSVACQFSTSNATFQSMFDNVFSAPMTDSNGRKAKWFPLSVTAEPEGRYALASTDNYALVGSTYAGTLRLNIPFGDGFLYFTGK